MQTGFLPILIGGAAVAGALFVGVGTNTNWFGRLVPCTSDAECGGTKGCVYGHCSTLAELGERCMSGQQCRTKKCRNQVCAECLDSSQCVSPSVCRTDGTCGPCIADADCPAESACEAGSCVDTSMRCLEDGDCPPADGTAVNGYRCNLTGVPPAAWGTCVADRCAGVTCLEGTTCSQDLGLCAGCSEHDTTRNSCLAGYGCYGAACRPLRIGGRDPADTCDLTLSPNAAPANHILASYATPYGTVGWVWGVPEPGAVPNDVPTSIGFTDFDVPNMTMTANIKGVGDNLQLTNTTWSVADCGTQSAFILFKFQIPAVYGAEWRYVGMSHYIDPNSGNFDLFTKRFSRVSADPNTLEWVPAVPWIRVG